MIDSAARAERFDPAPSAAPFFTWEVPQKPIVVRLPLPLIDRLENEAVENFRSVTSRGSEIGGVLWGAIEPGEQAIVSVVDYDLVVCDYSLGPLYRLADADLGRLDRALSQRGGSGLRPVGFFRSHTRKGLSLDADDLALLESRFKEAQQVALVIRPAATKASTAGIFFRESGTIHGETSYREFPFRSSLLAPSKPAEPAEAASPAQKSPARAQIVPIASRREVTPAPQPAPAPAPAAAPTPQPVPEQKAQTAPAAPPVEVKAATPPVEVKPATPPVEAAPAETAPEAAPAVQPKPAAEKPKPPAEKPAKSQEKTAKEKEKNKPETFAEKAARTLEEGSRTPVEKAETPAPAEIEQPEPEEEPEVVTPPKPKGETPVGGRVTNKLMWLGIGAIFPVLLSGFLFVYPGVLRRTTLPTSLTGQDTSALALRVERTGNELLLTWNRDSKAIQTASHAVLQISDGEQHENVDMDLAQLRNGSIVYLPVTADVVFRMEVSGKDQSKTTSESVRVLRTRPSPMDDAKGQQPAPAATPGKPVNGAPIPAGAPTATGAPVTTAPAQAIPGAPQTGAVTPNQPAANTAPAAQQPAPPPLKQFNTESLAQRLRPAHNDSIALPDAPTVAVSSPNPSLPFGSMDTPMPAAPRKAEAPVAAAPIKQSGMDTQGGNVQQAQVIVRKDPEYPRIAREAGAKGTVELVATIGVNGRVKSVKAIKGHPLLQKAAIDAVMQWVYKPTMLNGHPVEAQSTITLNFVSDR